MSINLEELERLAKEATPGPWTSDEGRGIWCPNAKISGQTKIFDIRGWGYFTGLGHGALGMSEEAAIKQQEVNGNYVASCSPDTVLALVRAVRAAIKMNEAGEEVARHADLTAHNNFNDADKELSAALEPFTTEDRT